MAILHSYMQEKPSKDLLYLAVGSAQRKAAQLGISEDEFVEVLARFEGMRKNAFNTSMYPEGFF